MLSFLETSFANLPGDRGSAAAESPCPVASAMNCSPPLEKCVGAIEFEGLDFSLETLVY